MGNMECNRPSALEKMGLNVKNVKNPWCRAFQRREVMCGNIAELKRDYVVLKFISLSYTPVHQDRT